MPTFTTTLKPNTPYPIPAIIVANDSLYNRFIDSAEPLVLVPDGSVNSVQELFSRTINELRSRGINIPALVISETVSTDNDFALQAFNNFSISTLTPGTTPTLYLGELYRAGSWIIGDLTNGDISKSSSAPANSFMASYRAYIDDNQFFLSFTVVPENSIVNSTIIPSALPTNSDLVLSLNIRKSGTSANPSYYSNIIRSGIYSTSETYHNYLANLQLIPVTEQTSTDPYTEIVPGSTTGGGDGNGDFTDDTIDEPTTPAISGLNSGFISAYSPSVAQLNALASYMWTSDFTTNLNKVFGDNPMGTILGLSAIPVSPITGSSQNVILGNVDTKIEMPVITSQYVKFNCGSINIQPKYGAFLDYEPYTSIDLFLPYIGLVQLSTNDVMGKSLAVTYTIDVLSGACVANVACGGTIMYTFEGACATQFPVTNNDYSNMFKAAIDAASSIVGAIGGAVASGMTGNVAGAVGAIADGMAGAAQAAMNAHPVVNRSGSLSGSAGLMGIQKPFIVWTTPNMVASNNQNSFIGYPNFITTSLSSLSGYTEVENINLGIAGATNEEVNEIKTLLRNGVIF